MPPSLKAIHNDLLLNLTLTIIPCLGIFRFLNDYAQANHVYHGFAWVSFSIYFYCFSINRY